MATRRAFRADAGAPLAQRIVARTLPGDRQAGAQTLWPGDRAESADRVGGSRTALKHGERVLFVSGATSNDTKERAIDGFNTPLYPEVLIATGVLGRGHRPAPVLSSRDPPRSAVEPAKLEQRTGRVDRIGSLSAATTAVG